MNKLIEFVKKHILIMTKILTANNSSNESTQQEATSQNSSAIVYRTKTGSKYHNAGCSYLKSSIQTTVSEAKKWD